MGFSIAKSRALIDHEHTVRILFTIFNQRPAEMRARIYRNFPVAACALYYDVTIDWDLLALVCCLRELPIWVNLGIFLMKYIRPVL